MAPKILVLVCNVWSPAHRAFLPASDLPTKAAVRGGVLLGSAPKPHRYGVCSVALSTVVDGLSITILARATRVENTLAPPVEVAVMSTTMNGFFAITTTASARWAVSSGPLAVTRSRATVRPQSWKAPSFSAAYRYAACQSSITSSSGAGSLVAWFCGPLAEAGPSIWVFGK